MNYYSLSSVWYYHVYMGGTKSKIQHQIDAQTFVNAKLSGASDAQAAQVVSPDAKPSSLANIATRLSNSPFVQEYITEALAANKVLVTPLIAKLLERTNAEKDLYFKGKYVITVPDYTIQLKAIDMLLKLMQAYTRPTPVPELPSPVQPASGTNTAPTPNPEVVAAITAAVKNGDIKALERVVFRDPKEVE